MNENISPEERLLKHIREGRSSPEKGGGKGPDLSAPGAKTPKGAGDDPEARFLSVLNRWLSLAAIALLGYLVYQFIMTPRTVDVMPPDAAIPQQTRTVDVQTQPARPFSAYIDEISRRDIFQSPLQRQTATPRQPQTSSDAQTKDLKLVGIVLDENPEAIIEDQMTKETFFLKQGEDIRGFMIEDIKEGKVILKREDQSFELTQ